jgi:hypothetical protein
MAYSCKLINTHSTKQLPFSVVTHPDICAHPCIQVLDIIHVGEKWQIINVYHDMRDISGLDTLLMLDLDPFIPTLIMGDFNTHSWFWSPNDVEPSYWAWRLEEWAVSNLLTLANDPGTITHRGANNERDSVLDLAWFNAAAIDRATFSDLQVDWEGSLGSDHMALHVTARTRYDLKPQDSHTTDPGYLVEDGAKGKWLETYKIVAQCNQIHYSTPSTKEEVEHAARCLKADIDEATLTTCPKCKPFHPKAAPWWTKACMQAAIQLRTAIDKQTQKTALMRLKGAVRVAKCAWVNGVIAQSSLWEVATWQHGRRTTKIPPLQGGEGLKHEHKEMTKIFSKCFLVETPPDIPLHLADDPQPLPS